MNTVFARIAVAAAVLGLITPGIVHAVSAQAELKACDGPKIVGRAVLSERPSEEGVKLVDISIVMTGISDGMHAVHIHEVASCTPCGSAKGHFDPGPASNASPDGNHPHHAGDLVNIRIENGYGAMSTTTSRVTLSDGPLSISDGDGSAFIVHVGEDTYCPQGVEKGCAGGARAACGIIEKM